MRLSPRLERTVDNAPFSDALALRAEASAFDAPYDTPHRAGDMATTTARGPLIGSLCSGYGGLDLGVQTALGGTLAWHAETNPDAAASWPGTGPACRICRTSPPSTGPMCLGCAS